MNLSFILLQAASSSAPSGGIGSFFANPLFMLIIIVVIMYFLMIRPQRKKQKEIEKFRNSLQVGQDVVTASGVYGTIKEINDNIIMLEIARGVVIKIEKSSVYADINSAAPAGK